MKDEGGGMKQGQKHFFVHPSSLRPHPLPLNRPFLRRVDLSGGLWRFVEKVAFHVVEEKGLGV